MRVCSFLCSDSLLYFFLFLSILYGVYTRDCSCIPKDYLLDYFSRTLYDEVVNYVDNQFFYKFLSNSLKHVFSNLLTLLGSVL